MYKHTHTLDVFAHRPIAAPHPVLPWGHLPQEPSLGYFTNVLVFWMMFVLGFLWTCSLLLQHCTWLGAVHTAYCSQSLIVRRNVPLYMLHILVDPVLAAVWLRVLVAGWCGCTETLLTSDRLCGFILLYVVVAYVVELAWRARVDALLAFHHSCTIVAIVGLLTLCAVDFNASADGVLVYGAFALLEQPTAVALLLQHILPEGRAHTAAAWRVSVGLGFGLKTLSLVLSALLVARDWSLMPVVIRCAYTAGWLLYCGIQVLTGYARYSICCRVMAKTRSS